MTLDSESNLTSEIMNLISRHIGIGRVEEIRLQINEKIDSIASQLLFDADKKGYDIKRVADIDEITLAPKYYFVITKRKH